MQTILMRLLELAQRKHEWILEVRSLAMELQDYADREAEILNRLYQMQRTDQMPRVTMPAKKASNVVELEPNEPGEVEAFSVPNVLKSGPTRRGD